MADTIDPNSEQFKLMLADLVLAGKDRLVGEYRGKVGEANNRLEHAFEALREERETVENLQRNEMRLTRELTDRPTKVELAEVQGQLAEAMTRLQTVMEEVERLTGLVSETERKLAEREAELATRPQTPDQLLEVVRPMITKIFDDGVEEIRSIQLVEKAA
jgi:chromosome segregation ATPase